MLDKLTLVGALIGTVTCGPNNVSLGEQERIRFADLDQDTPPAQGAFAVTDTIHFAVTAESGALEGLSFLSSDPGVLALSPLVEGDDQEQFLSGDFLSPGEAVILVVNAQGVEVDRLPVRAEEALSLRVEVAPLGLSDLLDPALPAGEPVRAATFLHARVPLRVFPRGATENLKGQLPEPARLSASAGIGLQANDVALNESFTVDALDLGTATLTAESGALSGALELHVSPPEEVTLSLRRPFADSENLFLVTAQNSAGERLRGEPYRFSLVCDLVLAQALCARTRTTELLLLPAEDAIGLDPRLPGRVTLRAELLDGEGRPVRARDFRVFVR